MAYFDFNKKNGRAIAQIEGGNGDGEIIYLHDKPPKACCKKCMSGGGCTNCLGDCCKNCNNDEEDIDENDMRFPFKDELNIIKRGGYKELKLKTGVIRPLPHKEKDQRDCIFISAPSGSGKSRFAGKYIEKYLEANPKKEIFVFSSKTKDKELDKLPIHRMKIDEDMLDNPIKTDEMKNSLVLFDDIDKIADKELLKAVQHLRDQLMEEGRDRGIDIVCTSHNPTNNKETKASMLESRSLVLFPSCGDEFHVRSVLKNYYGLQNKRIDEIIQNYNSRWILCNKWAPKYILHEGGAFFP